MPPSLTRPPCARPALLLPRGPGRGLVQGTHPGGKPWGASTPLSPGSLGRCGADFCYLLTIKVLRDVLCASALGGGEVGEAVCATQHPSSPGTAWRPCRYLSCPVWLLLGQDRAALAPAEPELPRPELLLVQHKPWLLPGL